MDKNSSVYVFVYAAVVTLLVAVLLTLTSLSLKPMKDANELNYKKKDILGCVMTADEVKALSGDQVSTKFEEVIEQVVLNSEGKVDANSAVAAIDIDLAKEQKKALNDQQLPLFVANTAEGKKYIIPVRGSGLWDAIWGFIAVDKDGNTISSVSFDHAGETPGLGAEIKDNAGWKAQFVGKKLFDGDQFVSVDVVKGGVKKPDYQVDGISGATITGDGVADMMKKDIAKYESYLKSL